jgi:hypothetical protein
LNEQAKEGRDLIDKRAYVNWKEQDDQGFGSVHSNIQRLHTPDLESLTGENLWHRHGRGVRTEEENLDECVCVCALNKLHSG